MRCLMTLNSWHAEQLQRESSSFCRWVTPPSTAVGKKIYAGMHVPDRSSSVSLLPRSVPGKAQHPWIHGYCPCDTATDTGRPLSCFLDPYSQTTTQAHGVRPPEGNTANPHVSLIHASSQRPVPCGPATTASLAAASRKVDLVAAGQLPEVTPVGVQPRPHRRAQLGFAVAVQAPACDHLHHRCEPADFAHQQMPSSMEKDTPATTGVSITKETPSKHCKLDVGSARVLSEQ